MAREFRLGIWYDFRNPAPWRRPYEQLYREYLDQVAWAERVGFDSVWITEHHFAEDGYTPSPLLLLAAIASRTERMRLGTNLVVPALHDPVRLAEDVATLAICADRPVDFGIAAGYRELEFAAFGRDVRHRPSLLEESVEVLRRAWSGTPVAFAGRRFQVPDVTVAPLPSRTPRILIGGHVDVALERAARLGDGFLAPSAADFDRFLAATERVGRDPAQARITLCDWPIIAPDPEAEWARISPHAIHQLNTYISWGAFGPPDQVPPFTRGDDALAGSYYWLADADAAATAFIDMLERWPQLEDISIWAQLPGESAESGSARLAYVADEVLPRVRAHFAAVT
jgi:alkanesulfonate monooxygenase SsuD/methylene tetrahydromethanopterin reductase-like flavin-dependent oxidoreductase (luciferase family)